MFVKSGFASGGCCPTLKNYDRAENEIEFRGLMIVKCMSKEFIPVVSMVRRQNFLNSFVRIRGEGDEREETWVAKILFLCSYFLRKEAESVEVAF